MRPAGPAHRSRRTTMSSGRDARARFLYCVFRCVEVRARAIELSPGVMRLHDGMSQSRRQSRHVGAAFRIPIDVLARDPDSSLVPVESVQVAQMSEHDITYFRDGRCGEHFARAQVSLDLAEDPRPALCAAS